MRVLLLGAAAFLLLVIVLFRNELWPSEYRVSNAAMAITNKPTPQTPDKSVINPDELPDGLKQTVNQLLRPKDETYEVEKASSGSMIKLKNRKASVAVARINEEGEVQITDFTSPIK